MDRNSSDITLTPHAVTAALRLQAEVDEFKGLPLRLYIEGKGCDGFYYGVTFSPREPTDLRVTCPDLEVVIDADSLQFMRGSTVDWVDDERGKGFVVENPRQRIFRGKFYKRQAWIERLSSSSQEPV